MSPSPLRFSVLAEGFPGILRWGVLALSVSVATSASGQSRDASRLSSSATSHVLVVERIIGSEGDGPGEMSFPQGVAVDGTGRLFVSDTGNHRVLRFDPKGGFVGEFGGLGFELGRFDGPRDLFVGESLQLWVLDGENLRVVRYDLRGNLQGLVLDLNAEAIRLEVGRVRPAGLAADSGGLLYLTDAAGEQLLSYEPLSGGIEVIGGFGTQPGRFRTPSGLAVNGRGTVFVADAGNGRIQAIDAFGGFVRAWPLSGPHEGGRVSIALLPENRFVVAEADSNRISVWAADGAPIARLHRRGDGPGEIDAPQAVTTDRQGRIYVADTNNHRVQVLRLAVRAEEDEL